MTKHHIRLAVGFIVFVVIIIGSQLLKTVRAPQQQTTVVSTPTTAQLPPGPRRYALPSIKTSVTDSYPFDIQPYREGYTLGMVTIYLSDLDKRFSLLYPSTLEHRMNLSNWHTVSDWITTDGILLNEAAHQGFLTPTQAAALDPIEINRAREYLEKQGTQYISGEIVTVWFHNLTIPSMGVSEARKRVLSIVTPLQKHVKEGTLTMREAADRIIALKSLEEIDEAYTSNAYAFFSHSKPGFAVFFDKNLLDTLWKLEAGEVSDLVVGHDGDDNHEAFYAFFKVNDKKTDGFENIDTLIRQRKQEGWMIPLQ